MNIVIANRQRSQKINTRLLKQIVGGLFAELKITDPELGINLVAAREMTLVNETFLRHEGSTDVITFDHRDSESQTLNARREIQGELFVCLDEAVLQAKKFGTSWQSEVVRYIIHGVLHLLGHDDSKPHLRHRMKRAENRLLRMLAKRFSLAQLSATAKLRA